MNAPEYADATEDPAAVSMETLGNTSYCGGDDELRAATPPAQDVGLVTSLLAPTEAAVAKEAKKRQLSWWRLMLIAFLFTCSGPLGLEAVLKAGGSRLAIIGLFSVPIIYVIPQILVVSEMGSMMPSNHGPIMWVHRAFGEFAGFYNSWIMVVSDVVDLAAYPTLFGDYICDAFFPDISFGGRYLFRFSAVMWGTLIAVLPSKGIGTFSSLVTVLVSVPFFVGFFKEIPHFTTENWGHQKEDVRWDVLISSLLWLYTGWGSLGSLAGEVKHNRVLLQGLFSALALDLVMYLVPLLTALNVLGFWTEGYFVKAYNEIIPGIGYVLGVVIPLTVFGLYYSALTCYARTLWGVAELGLAPRFLSYETETGVPLTSILLHGLCCLALCALNFDLLITIEYTVAAISYILIFLAFVKLRYTENDVHRPFRVGGGWPVAILITMTKVLLLSTILVTGLMDWRVAIAFVAANIAIAMAYFIFTRIRKGRVTLPGSSSKADTERLSGADDKAVESADE